MSVQHFHSMCCKHVGRAVVIGTNDGRFHRGIIQSVRGDKVYLEPFGGRRNYGGFGSGFFGFRAGRGVAFGLGIAVGSIVTFALLPFFFF